jgi:hypothetical protein
VSREQVENMRKGMATIIPIQLLSLFTWQELELNVCGKNKIDIQLLRENTRYQSGFSDEDEHVQMMWRVLESFSVRLLFNPFAFSLSLCCAEVSSLDSLLETLVSAVPVRSTNKGSSSCASFGVVVVCP